MAIHQISASFNAVGFFGVDTTKVSQRRAIRAAFTGVGGGSYPVYQSQLIKATLAPRGGFGTNIYNPRVAMFANLGGSGSLTADFGRMFPISASFGGKGHMRSKVSGDLFLIYGDLYGTGRLTVNMTVDSADPINPNIQERSGSLLLYRNAAGLEKALADVDAYRLIRTYAELPRDQWDPYRIHVINLPYLAWAMGVNLWEQWWTEEFRRYWIANQWTFKAQRGSLPGLKIFVRAVGGEVKRVIRPPAITYPGPKYTDEQRAQFVSRFPQLRAYPFAEREKLPWLCYLGGFSRDRLGRKVFVKNGAFLGPLRPLYPTQQTTGSKYLYRYTLWDRGVETQLTQRKIVKEIMGPSAGWGFTPGVSKYDDEIILPEFTKNNYFLGHGKHYLRRGPKFAVYLGRHVPLRVIRIGRSGPLPLEMAKAQYQTISPSEDLINIYPEHVYQRHPIRKAETYLAKHAAKRQWYLNQTYLPRSNAWQFLFQRWYLFDVDRVPPQFKQGGSYLGHTRLGIDKYTAEAKIKIRTKVPWWQTQVGGQRGYVRGYLMPRNNEAVDRLLRGVRASMALRDTILVDTKVTRVLQNRDIINIDGSHYVGELVED